MESRKSALIELFAREGAAARADRTATGSASRRAAIRPRHLCGHDAHTTMLLGAGALLVARPPTSGNVKLLFQPAEEDGGGAERMIAYGALEAPEVGRAVLLCLDSLQMPRYARGHVGMDDAVAALTRPGMRAYAFEMAVGSCDADGHTSGAERAFLDEFERALGLEHAAAVAILEQAEALADAPLVVAPAAAGALGATATSAVTTFATTYAIGKVADAYYGGGRTLEAVRIRELFARELERGRMLFDQHQGAVQHRRRRRTSGS